MTISLDNRPHPHRSSRELSPDLTGRSNEIRVSTSLHPDAESYMLMAYETDRQDSIFEQIILAASSLR